MKVEFNGGDFNSNMNFTSAEIHTEAFERGRRIISENAGLILGILSFILALSNLPFGLFMNFSTEILSKFTEQGLGHWISVLFVVTVIVALLSVLCGVFSVVLFAKSDKKSSHCAGLVVAIISFVLCAVCLGLNIAGMVAW